MKENDVMEYHPERRKKMPPGNEKNVTWQWLVGILLILVFAAGGIILADTKTEVQKVQTKVEQVQEKKLDKETYYRDIGEIKVTLKEIVEKIDKIKR